LPQLVQRKSKFASGVGSRTRGQVPTRAAVGRLFDAGAFEAGVFDFAFEFAFEEGGYEFPFEAGGFDAGGFEAVEAVEVVEAVEALGRPRKRHACKRLQLCLLGARACVSALTSD
jgi:hypothetical protein